MYWRICYGRTYCFSQCLEDFHVRQKRHLESNHIELESYIFTSEFETDTVLEKFKDTLQQSAVLWSILWQKQDDLIQTVPSFDPEAKRVLIHWEMDKSVTSPSCLPTKRTPSISFSRWHLTGSSTAKSLPLPTFVMSILKMQFPTPTYRIS